MMTDSRSDMWSAALGRGSAISRRLPFPGRRPIPLSPISQGKRHRRPTERKPSLLGRPLLSAALRRCTPSPHTSGARSRQRRRRGSLRDGGRSLLGDSGLAQAVNDALVFCDPRGVVIAWCASPKPGDGEGRADGQSRPSLGPRLRKAPKTRQGRRQNEMGAGKPLLVSTERRSQATASSSPPRRSLAAPTMKHQRYTCVD